MDLHLLIYLLVTLWSLANEAYGTLSISSQSNIVECVEEQGRYMEVPKWNELFLLALQVYVGEICFVTIDRDCSFGL